MVNPFLKALGRRFERFVNRESPLNQSHSGHLYMGNI